MTEGVQSIAVNLIQNRAFLLLVALSLIASAVVLHRAHMGTLYRKLSGIKKRDFKMAQLEEAYNRLQGSNFNTAAIISWNLLFLSLGLLFFLSTDIYGLGLMEAPHLASSFFGFGVLIMIITFALYSRLPRMYRFYSLTKSQKALVFYAAPLLLVVSLIISIHLGTLYPYKDDLIWGISYILTLSAEGILVLPIYLGVGGGLK